jgi:hypothetical protein
MQVAVDTLADHPSQDLCVADLEGPAAAVVVVLAREKYASRTVLFGPPQVTVRENHERSVLGGGGGNDGLDTDSRAIYAVRIYDYAIVNTNSQP